MGPFIGVVEIGCGALILIGLFTRLAALLLLADMTVAILSTKIPILIGTVLALRAAATGKQGLWSMPHEARTDSRCGSLACSFSRWAPAKDRRRSPGVWRLQRGPSRSEGVDPPAETALTTAESKGEGADQKGDGKTSLGELAGLFLRLGTTAFGGPAAHIAMMRDEVVTRQRWLTDEQFLDLLGATNLIPGPNSTEMAIDLGWRQRRWAGLLVAGVSFIVPAMLMTGALGWAYVRFGKLPQLPGCSGA